MFQFFVYLIFIVWFVGGIFTAIKSSLLFVDLRNSNLIGKNWNGTARIKDLKHLQYNSKDEIVKEKAAKTIMYLKWHKIIIWVGFGLMILLFLINGVIS